MRPILLTITFLFLFGFVFSQTIGTFNSVQPTTQTQNLVLPPTHTFQRIIRSGAPLTSGETAGNNFDFTGYVPIGGSSINGFLSISSETAPAGVCVLSLNFNSGTKLWQTSSSGNVAFPFAAIGFVSAFCAGTVMPNNHVMVCEETIAGGDFNGDGYNDDGWIVEIDPATRTVINQDGVGGVDKCWAMGRQKHEDVAIRPDMSVAYWSADNDTAGYVYKFIPTVPGNFSAGTLYILQTTGALGTGVWKQIPNATPSERNNTVTSAKDSGAYNFVRIEGLEFGPDGKVYFAATTSGRIYRFRDLGTSVDNLDVFLESTNYDVDGAGPFTPEPWGSGADNIAFDGEGNLWVLQDGGRNHIWVVSPDHTAANPKVRLFATTPAGSEPTGITFSPDYRFLFLSMQHPSGGNTTVQTDAAGQSVVWDNSTALVIARKEFLGTNLPLPLNLLSFDAKQTKASVQLSWKTPVVVNGKFDVERSEDGLRFKAIGTVAETSSSFGFTDADLPAVSSLYYRIKQIEANGRTEYSGTKTVRLRNGEAVFTIYPSPVTDKLHLRFNATVSGPVLLTLSNASGLTVHRSARPDGSAIWLDAAALPAGVYQLTIEVNSERFTSSFVKQ